MKLQTLREGLLAPAYRSTEQIDALALSLASKLAQSRNATQLVNQLPAEILSDIFITHRACCGISTSRFKAYLVCHSWRMLVMTTPRIWSWFRIVVDHLSEVPALHRVEKLLSLSADVPLHLEIQLSSQHGAAFDSVPPSMLRVMTQAIERCQSLHLVADSLGSWSLYPLPSPLPRLKELRLTVQAALRPYCLSQLLHSVSSFEIVEDYLLRPSNRVTFTPLVFSAERLKVLRLSDAIHPNASYGLVSAASTSLHTLIWQYNHVLLDEDDAVRSFPPLILPSLVQLVLCGDHSGLLDEMVAPKLSSFTHNGADHEILRDGIFGTTSRFPSLRTVNFAGHRPGFRISRGYQVTQLLRTHPCLSWIILANMTLEDWEDLLPLQDHPATRFLRVTCLDTYSLGYEGANKRDDVIRTILRGTASSDGMGLEFVIVRRDAGFREIILEFPKSVKTIERGYGMSCTDRLMEESWDIMGSHVFGSAR